MTWIRTKVFEGSSYVPSSSFEQDYSFKYYSRHILLFVLYVLIFILCSPYSFKYYSRHVLLFVLYVLIFILCPRNFIQHIVIERYCSSLAFQLLAIAPQQLLYREEICYKAVNFHIIQCCEIQVFHSFTDSRRPRVLRKYNRIANSIHGDLTHVLI